MADPSARCVRVLGALVVSMVLGAATQGAAGAVSRLIIFGDSLSDTGNVHWWFSQPPAPYYDGRFSNGPVWVEELAAQLGAGAPLYSQAGGTNYAYGGAETGPGTFLLFLRNMGSQVNQYLSSGPDPMPDDLFVLLGGANDFFDGQTDASVVVDNLIGHINTLAGAGAEQFLVANLPPLGQTPAHLGMPDEAALDQLTIDFNTLYDAALDEVEATLDVSIVRFDLFSFFQDVIADPGPYGFTNVTQPALPDSGIVVPNPDEYLFWDTVHPTRVAHALFGDLAAEALAGTTPGDLDGDGDVDFADLLLLLGTWGSCAGCPADLDGDGVVAFADLLLLLAEWG